MSTCKITKSFVDKLVLPEKGQVFYRDSELKGFAVRVTQGGSKAFVLEKRINRKLKRITLGRYPEITVEMARKEALKYLGEIATGIDPIAKRQQAEAEQMTLWQVWQDYRKIKSYLKDKTYVQYEMYLNGELKDWKNKRLVDITKDMVSTRHGKLLKSHSPSYANTAMRILSAIYKFAKDQYEDNSGLSLFPHNPVERLGQIKAWAKEPRRQTVIKPKQFEPWYEALQEMKFNTGADSQHDGTPHWHILLFAEPEHMDEIKHTISHYALEEDGDEKGALENRCDFKMIDPNKGSATGYIAKYVSKNIDGEGLDKGVYGEDPITAAQRVDAWSSCWCIRQFQQIGGASVSVWRELRRLKQSLGIDEIIEKARKAADESKWHEYINAMGGVFAKRKDQPIKLAYDASFDNETGECKVGFYDGNIIQTIKGLMFKGHRILTRFFSWRLERANVVCYNLEFCK